MKFFRNIPGGFRLFNSVRVFNKAMPAIESARNAGNTKKEKEIIGENVAQWIDSLIRIFDITIHIEGKENIPEKDGFVFISNHQGYADIITLLKVMEGRQLGFIAKETLQKVPYFGKWISAIRGVYIKRGDAREALKSIQAGVEHIQNGFNLVIFPEGTRSQSTQLGEFKAGSFKLATRAKVPIVPVVINGTRHLFEDRGIFTNGAVIDVRILPPIDTASLDRHGLANIHYEVENTIRENFDDLVQIEKERTERSHEI